jgi:hypothetical protein
MKVISSLFPRLSPARALILGGTLVATVAGCGSTGNGQAGSGGAGSASGGAGASTGTFGGSGASGGTIGPSGASGASTSSGNASAGTVSTGNTSGSVSSGAGGSGGAASGSTSGGTGTGTGSGNPFPATDAAIEGGASPTSPAFGSNVLIFSPTMAMATIQMQIDTIYAAQVDSQFGTSRYTFMFLPGKYTLNISVGYYMQFLGLGQSPGDVVITGYVRSVDRGGTSTVNFWRGVENLTVVSQATDVWSVSQGATFRRVHVQGSVALSDNGTSSGGFIADSQIDGTVTSGSQQQWFTRNSQIGGWNQGVWNMVFVGVMGAPTGMWPGAPYSVLASTPAVQEKPYLFVDATGSYAVRVPALRTSSQGTSWSAGTPPGTTLSLSQFYLAQPATDTAASLNAALSRGLNVIFTPGVYQLAASLQVTRPDTIILGLGLTTLVPGGGTPAVVVSDVDGVRIGGIIFDAGATTSPTLIEIGTGPSTINHSADPITLYDTFCRVGGATLGTALNCLTINSNDVVGDNLWLWRADHGAGVGWTSNTCPNGLTVNGDRATMYGLAVEHFQQYQTIWNGNGGQVYFYQSEMPYDPPNQAAWMNGTGNGYASYKVGSAVTSHTGLGLGVYSAFRQVILADDGFEAPTAAGISLHHLITVWLNSTPGSGISHVLNATGNAVGSSNSKATIN